VKLQGANELRKRMRALSTVADPASRESLPSRWQRGTVRAAQGMIPVRTGETRRSIRPGTTRRGRATVVGKFTVNFIDAGSKAHDEPRQPGLTKTGRVSRRKRGTGKVLKFQMGGRTVFSKKVHKPRIAAHPFKKRAARAGLESVNWVTMIYGFWNRAA
jgi:hypothetical protein